MVTEIFSYRPDNETEEEKPKNKNWNTSVTSVSISNEFKKIIDKFDLSPTDVFRRGVGVTLADMGIAPYNTEMNANRLRAFKMKIKLDSFEFLIKELEDSLTNLKKILSNIKEDEDQLNIEEVTK